MKIRENDEKLKQYSKTSPENILNNNKNFIISFQTFDKGGTYSLIEMEYYKKMMEEIDNIIKQSIVSRDTNNKTKVTTVFITFLT